MESVIAGTLKARARRARSRAARAAALAAGMTVLAAGAAASQAAAATPCAVAAGGVGQETVVTCGFTGVEQTWTVPPGVTAATFDLSGAQGGSDTLSTGGLGARAQATLPVTPGDVYELRVGGVGRQAYSCASAGAGGYNGGGMAATFCDPSWLYRIQGVGGGGATDVRLGGSTLADRVLVAAGGGGAPHDHYGNGGAGGAPDGQDGSVRAGGAFGRGATQSAGGAGAVVTAPGGASGTDGALGVGGTGGAGATSGAGGGGGGLYGGGGGGSYPCVGGCGGDGGGGGGSSYGPPGTTYTAGAQTGAGRAQITYTTVHPAPACTDRSGETSNGRPLPVALSCSDESGVPFAYEVVQAPGKGTLGTVDQQTGGVTYTPHPGQTGTDTFTYRASSVNGTGATATVTVTLLPPPACQDVEADTGHDAAVTVALSCSDPDADADGLSYAVASPPAHGSLGAPDQDAGTVVYTPDPGFSGADQFTYTATSVNGTSQVRVARIAVDPPPPTCAASTETVSASTPLAITLSCAGTASFPNTYAVVGPPQHGTLVGFDAATGALTYSPETGYVGTDTFTFRAANQGGASTTETVTIDVTLPPAPTCTAADATIGEGADSVVLQLDCTGADGFAIARAISTGPQHGTLSELDTAAGTVRYTPDAGFGGLDTFSFTGTNAGGTSVAADAQIAVLAPPSFDGGPGEGGSVTDARPTLAFSGGLAPGGFDCRVDQGAWSACSSPFTVPDALARGEHAVAVRSRGDGGELSRAVVRTFVVDGVTESVTAGDTVTSDVGGDGPGAGNPLELAVTSPAAGQVTLRALTAGAVTAPSGYELLGHGFSVTAPDAPDTDHPLRIELRLDASLVPAGVGLDRLVALRDGAPIGSACEVADRLGPTPCLASRTSDGETVTLVVLSDHASSWAVGRVLPVDDGPSDGGGAGGGGAGGDGGTGGSGGSGGDGGDGGSGGGTTPTPTPSSRFAFPRVTATRAGTLAVRFAFPRAGRVVLAATTRGARSPFTSAGALNRRSAAARQAPFVARTVRSPRARTVTVRLTATPRGRMLLRRHRRLAARLWVSFTPTGGSARVVSRAVTVRLPTG
jgi:hypothetical protein